MEDLKRVAKSLRRLPFVTPGVIQRADPYFFVSWPGIEVKIFYSQKSSSIQIEARSMNQILEFSFSEDFDELSEFIQKNTSRRSSPIPIPTLRRNMRGNYRRPPTTY